MSTSATSHLSTVQTNAITHSAAANPEEVQSVVPQNEEDTTDGNYKALDHLLTYKWANSTYQWFADCKYTGTVVGTLAPVQKAVMIKPIQHVANWTDSFCDRKLSTVDYFVDLSSAQIDDMTRLVKGTLGMIHLVTIKGVVEPTVKQVNAVGSQAHSLLHNENGKAIVPSVADPLVSPVNVMLEKVMEKKSLKPDAVGEQSSELKRSYKIIKHIIHGEREVKSLEINDEPEGNTSLEVHAE